MTAKFTRTVGDSGDVVKFYTKGGRQTSTLHMVRDVEALAKPQETKSTYSLAKN